MRETQRPLVVSMKIVISLSIRPETETDIYYIYINYDLEAPTIT